MKDFYDNVQGLKFNLGSGERWQEVHDKHGFEGIDIVNFGQKYVLDLRKDKLPVYGNSVMRIRMSHFLEHMTYDEAIKILNECWRVLHKDDGLCHIIVPSEVSSRAYLLTHRSFYSEDTFRRLATEPYTTYGIRNWKCLQVVTNSRQDIHAYIQPM